MDPLLEHPTSLFKRRLNCHGPATQDPHGFRVARRVTILDGVGEFVDAHVRCSGWYAHAHRVALYERVSVKRIAGCHAHACVGMLW